MSLYGANNTIGQLITAPAAGASLSKFPFYIPISQFNASLVSAARGDYKDIQVYDSLGNLKNREISNGNLFFGDDISTSTKQFQVEAGSGTDIANNAATWTDASAIGVYHLEESSGAAIDSTGNCNGTVTNCTYSQAAKLGNGYDFPNNAKIDLCEPTWGSNDVTVMAWVTSDTLATYDFIIGHTSGAWNNGLGFWYSIAGTYMYFFVNGYVSNFARVAYTASSSWTHFVGRYNHSTIDIWKDGAKTTGSSYSSNITQPAAGTKVIAGYAAGGSYWDGKQDEIRIYNVAKSDEWISYEYSNQNAPASFWTDGGLVYPQTGRASLNKRGFGKILLNRGF